MQYEKTIPKTALYRILGNDLPPRHKEGQTYRNLKFILEYEPNFINCQKRWVINRIVDYRMEQRLIALLERHRQVYIRIPFDFQKYKACGEKRIKDSRVAFSLRSKFDRIRHNQIIYFANNNGARNSALKDGKKIADWILPFDGNCFFNEEGWMGVVDKLSVQETADRCFFVPMYRLTDNKQCLNFKPEKYIEHEPQIIFGKESKFGFNESFRYGSMSKLELLKRLRFIFMQTYYGFIAGDSEYRCGYVLRLFSGVNSGEEALLKRTILRENAIDLMLQRLNRKLVHRQLSQNLTER